MCNKIYHCTIGSLSSIKLPMGRGHHDRNYPHLTSQSVALLVARRNNNWKVVGARPAKVVCITVLTGNHLG